MATDYDAPRRRPGEDEDDANVSSIEELRASNADRVRASSAVDVDEVAAANFELPGADLSGEVLEVDVVPAQEHEFTCQSCYLIDHPSMRSEPGSHICRDCA